MTRSAQLPLGRPMLRMKPDDFDGPQQFGQSSQPTSPQMMQFSDAAVSPDQQQQQQQYASAPETKTQEVATPQPITPVSKTGQLMGLARRGWWLSALTVALDGIAAIVAVVSGTMALLSVLFMDLALPSATSVGLCFLSMVTIRPPLFHAQVVCSAEQHTDCSSSFVQLSALAASIFFAAWAASAVIGMLAMSDSIKTYFQLHKRIDIMQEGEDKH
eukprot:1317544-Rhodomonas_salina.3